MPAWLMPALKAVIPHIGTIVAAAAPVFTKKKGDAAANEMALLQQQITELQAAASANAAHIKELAAQIEKTVSALESGAAIAERAQQRGLVLGITASVISVLAGIAALVIFFAR